METAAQAPLPNERLLPEKQEEPSRRVITMTFVLVTLAVQALMSWDGGATQMSTAALLQSPQQWQPSELGLLLAIDRIGVVLCSAAWSEAFRNVAAKPLVVLAIAAKSLSCLLFGILELKWSMLLARFSMGAWEGLFGVWAIAWVGQRAPEHKGEAWQNYLSLAAAAGNGIGGFVASALSSRYALAFETQAFLLALIALVACVLPGSAIALKVEVPRHDQKSRLAKQRSSDIYPQNQLVDHVQQHPNIRKSVTTYVVGVRRLVWDTPLWFYTGMAFSLCFFVTTGINCLWQNTVVHVWAFTPFEATILFQVVSVAGGLPGVILGEKIISRKLEGLDGLARKQGVLRLVCRVTLAVALCGTLGTVCLAIKVQNLVYYNVEQDEWGVILVILVATIGALLFGINAVQGFLIEQNRMSVSEDKQTVAAGYTLICQNLFGFSMGAILPGEVTSLFGGWVREQWPQESAPAVDGAQFTFGMSFVFLMTWMLVYFTHRARGALSG